MKRTLTVVPHLLAVMLLTVLVSCTSDRPGPTGLHPVVLRIDAGAVLAPQGVPTEGGASVVDQFTITVLDRDGDVVRFDATGASDPEGAFDALTMSSSQTTITVLLTAGKYRFITAGMDSSGEMIVYGESVAEVGHEATSVMLSVHTLIGSVELVEEGLRHYVVAGEVIDLYLRVRTSIGSFDVPLADFTVEYELEPSLGEVEGSGIGARAYVTSSPTSDTFVLRAIVRGWHLKDGAPTSHGKFIATYTRQFAHAIGISIDVVPPSLVFEPPSQVPAGESTPLGGAASDEVGVANVRVYEGPVLLASTSAQDVADGAAAIDFTDTSTGAWSFDWFPSGTGSFRLTAIATDSSGNETRVTREVAVEASAPPPASIAGLHPLSSEQPFDETAGNCAADGLDLPGQGLQAVGAGLQAVGAVGGIFLGTPADFAGNAASPEKVAQDLWQVLGEPNYHDRVAIVVVDDFGGTYELPDSLVDGSEVTQQQLESWFDSGELSHGALVLHHLLRMLASSGFDDGFVTTNPVTGEPIYIRWTDDGGKLVVQTVDTDDRDTAEIVSVLRDSILELAHHEDHEFSRFVVNMSFAVVPCAVAADLGASSVDTFEEYVQKIRTLNGIGAQYETELSELLTAPLGAGDDPLLAYLDCPLPVAHKDRCDGWDYHAGAAVESIVHVASSGNLGHDFALYPSAWPTVISVSSLDVDGNGYSSTRSGFANSGEVAAPGSAFMLVATPGQAVAYAGTSFSAPVVTLFTALDTITSQRCDPGNPGVKPATGPDLAHGTYVNTPLDTIFGEAQSAVSLYCD